MKRKIVLSGVFSLIIILSLFFLNNKSYATDLNYKIETKQINRVEPRTNSVEFIQDLESKIKTENTDLIELYEFFFFFYSKVTTGLVKTGMIATKNLTSITDEGNGVKKIHAEKTFRISVIGDINKDGELDAVDLTRMIKHIVRNI